MIKKSFVPKTLWEDRWIASFLLYCSFEGGCRMECPEYHGNYSNKKNKFNLNKSWNNKSISAILEPPHYLICSIHLWISSLTALESKKITKNCFMAFCFNYLHKNFYWCIIDKRALTEKNLKRFNFDHVPNDVNAFTSYSVSNGINYINVPLFKFTPCLHFLLCTLLPPIIAF